MSSTALAPPIRHRAAPVGASRSAAAGPTARSRSGQVRLTRRGRVVVLVLGLLVVLAIGVWLAAGSAATRDAGAAQVELVTVAPGETLWGIAAEAADSAGESDVGAMVQRIEEMNSLDGSVVYVGQELRVPVD